MPFRALDKGQGPGGAASTPDRQRPGASALSDLQRKVLLLTMLEDFSVEQAAEILDIAPHEAEEALGAARDVLRRGMSVRVLVIEDESVIALNVAQIVRSAGHQVIGIAASEKAAIDLAEKHMPDLVIADVQLRGEDDGRAAVREILKSLSVPVIFVTGFPERLLTGQGIEPTFVITKPFAPDHLKMAISQALSPGEV
jgi:CheY-like chemotaxis protein